MAYTRTVTRSNANIQVGPNEPGLVGGWNMRSVDGTVLDVSGNGNDGVGTNAINLKRSLGHGLGFDGVGSGIKGTTPTITGYPFSIALWTKPRIGSGAGDIFDLVDESAANVSFGISIDASGQLRSIAANGGADDYGTSSIDARGKSNHAVVVFESATSRKLYLNNELDNTATTSRVWNTNVDVFSAGYRADSSPGDYFEGDIIGNVQVLNYAVDQTWVTRQYNKGKTALFKTEYGVNVSTAPTTVGYLENSPLQVQSGSFQISTDTIDGRAAKVIECVASGDISLKASYYHQDGSEGVGRWEGSFYRAATAGTTIIGYSSTETNRFESTSDGYVLFQQVAGNTLVLGRIDNGSLSVLGTFAGLAVATMYDYIIILDNYGNHSVSLRGGVFENFFEVISAVDSTYSNSVYQFYSLRVGDKIAYASLDGSKSIIKRLLP